MRVLHLLASPAFSGPAETITQLALAQRDHGHQVTVAVDRLRPRPSSEEPAVPRLQALGLLDDGHLELSTHSGPLAWLSDGLRLHRRALDVLHAHFSHDHLLARLAGPSGAVVIRSVHAARSLRPSLPRADGWTAPTPALLAQLPPGPALVLPALVDPAFKPGDRPALRSALGLPAGPLIGMVSTFQSSRRHGLALEAFALVAARHPTAHLLLVGDGVLEVALRRQVTALGLTGRVSFTGYQQGPAFVKHLQALDEVWILGLGNDFSGRAAAQARACGARVVAVDEGALGPLADQLVPPDPAALAAAALGAGRRLVELSAPAEVAAQVLELYTAARQARA